MRKFLMITAMLTGLSFATFAEEKVDNKENVVKTQYCYAGVTDCFTQYSACLSWQLTSEEQIALQQSRTRAVCGGGDEEEEIDPN
jgi:hypothetical protein